MDERTNFNNQVGMGRAREQAKTETQTETQTRTFGSNINRADIKLTPAQKKSVEDVLRHPRTQGYLDTIHMIDMLSSNDEDIIEKLKEVVDEDVVEEFREMTVEEMLEEIRAVVMQEFEQALQIAEVPIEMEGILSQCYISGCYIHAIDKNGAILEHYRSQNEMPEPLRMGWTVYPGHGKCSCVEVYSNCCRIVSNSGEVKVVWLDEIQGK